MAFAIRTAPKERDKMKAILLTTYFCILLRGTLSISYTDTHIAPLIPEGYVNHHEKYYKVYTKPETWEKAREVCTSDGADLVTVDSREEATFVQSLILEAYSSGYLGAWIGFRDFGNQDWKTVKSMSLSRTGYNIWWPKSTKRVGGCGTMKICSRYDARDCNQRLMFVCKLEK